MSNVFVNSLTTTIIDKKNSNIEFKKEYDKPELVLKNYLNKDNNNTSLFVENTFIQKEEKNLNNKLNNYTTSSSIRIRDNLLGNNFDKNIQSEINNHYNNKENLTFDPNDIINNIELERIKLIPVVLRKSINENILNKNISIYNNIDNQELLVIDSNNIDQLIKSLDSLSQQNILNIISYLRDKTFNYDIEIKEYKEHLERYFKENELLQTNIDSEVLDSKSSINSIYKPVDAYKNNKLVLSKELENELLSTLLGVSNDKSRYLIINTIDPLELNKFNNDIINIVKSNKRFYLYE